MALTLAADPPIFIVGAGALGSFVAARLALAGQAVCLIGRTAAVQAIHQGGLRLRSANGEQTAQLTARSDIAAVQAAPATGVVLVCVKSADTETVARQLAPWLHPQVLVVSLQNGVANAPVLMRQLRQPVAVALAYVAASMPAPGVVQHNGGQELVLGMAARPGAAALPPSPALEGLADALQTAGFGVRLSTDATAEAWGKLIVNCACNAISALTQAPYAVMAAMPAIADLQDTLVREAVAVAQADGVAMDEAALRAATRRVAVTMAAQRSSTAQDLARGRPTEIDHLNGHIVARGAALGVATPANQAVWALVKLAEAQAGGSAPL
jgi:2-dehydropantoate 2-reductase